MNNIFTKGMVTLLSVTALSLAQMYPIPAFAQEEASSVTETSQTTEETTDESPVAEAPDYAAVSVEGLSLEETANVLNDLFIQSLNANQPMTREDLETVLRMEPTREDAFEGYTMDEYDIESDGNTLTVYAEYTESDNTVQNMTVNIEYPSNLMTNTETAESNYQAMVDLIQSDYELNQTTSAQDALAVFGNPTNYTLVGEFEMYVYSVDPNVLDVDQLDFVSVTDGENLLTFNRHETNEEQLNTSFGQDASDLNQLSHTSGVTLEQMRSIFGNPSSIYYDLVNQTINYIWFSNADEVASEIYYSTGFNGISNGMNYSLVDSAIESNTSSESDENVSQDESSEESAEE